MRCLPEGVFTPPWETECLGKTYEEAHFYQPLSLLICVIKWVFGPLITNYWRKLQNEKVNTAGSWGTAFSLTLNPGSP